MQRRSGVASVRLRHRKALPTRVSVIRNHRKEMQYIRFAWCPCMAINVSVQYNGGFLPDIILLTECYHHRGTRLNAMRRFIFAAYSMILPKRFGIFPPCLEDTQKV